jgi:hypothetical protein
VSKVSGKQTEEIMMKSEKSGNGNLEKYPNSKTSV